MHQRLLSWKCWTILLPESVDSKFRNLSKEISVSVGNPTKDLELHLWNTETLEIQPEIYQNHPKSINILLFKFVLFALFSIVIHLFFS